jgi:hypothetical protein
MSSAREPPRMGGGNGRPGFPMPRMGMIATGGSVGAAMSAQVLYYSKCHAHSDH